MDSILTSVKKMCNVSEEYEVFDMDIIFHINSVFMYLWQIGVGPSEPFRIEDKYNLWTEFIPADDLRFEAVKSYVGKKVKMLFDPSSNGTLLSSEKEQIAELEWRLNLMAEMH